MGMTLRSRDHLTCYANGYNGSGSDIAKGLVLKDDATNLDGVALATAVTDTFVGISTGVMENAYTRSYQSDGKALVLAGGVIAKGDLLTVDATSRVVKASAPSTTAQNYIGRAVTAAGGAGEYVEVELWKVAQSFVGSSTVATIAALKAIAAASRYAGQKVVVQENNSTWIFNATSTAADATDNLVVSPTAGNGRWLRADKVVDLKLAIAFDTTDAAVLFTVPAGMRLALAAAPFWEVTGNWTGGVASAIGLSSDQTAPALNAKGDLLGGAGGDVEAGMTAAAVMTGTIGTKVAAPACVLLAGKKILFNRINSAFTAGSGFAHVPVVLLASL